jgi:hypothetical protein
MLWALTKPLFDASTDLGAIAPLIVFTKAIFFEAESSSLLARLIGVADVSKVRKVRKTAASEIFLARLLGTR